MGAVVAVASDPRPPVAPPTLALLAPPLLPVVPPETAVLLAPPPFDWQLGANHAKAAKAAPDTKFDRQRKGLLMGTSSARE